MAIDPDIRDQAYQFFIQEAPELLQTIETELLTLRQDRNTAKVHNLMRAAHSIKGGAASVGLDAIKTLAHRLEDIFKALHHETLKIDSLLETSLLQAYDCLRSPLMEEVTLGYFDAEQVMTVADPVFTQLEAQLDEFLGEAASLPSSIELGIDITLSIFEVDVSQGLERLAAVLAKHHNGTMAAELRAQAEVFVGIAELLSLPGFGTIAQATLAALNAHPQRALEIAQLALIDFYAAQQAVIAGDRSEGGAPSVALIELANLSSIKESHFSVSSATELEIVEPHLLSSLDTIWSDLDEEEILLPSLEGTWDDFAIDFQELTQAEDVEIELPSSPVGIVSDYVSTLSSNEASSNQETIGANPQPQIEEWVQSVEQAFDSLPSIVTPDTATPVDTNLKPKTVELEIVESAIAPIVSTLKHDQKSRKSLATEAPPQLSVRVNLDRLERMNNLVGEFTINRNTLSLQNEQLRRALQELLRRFSRFQEMGNQLRDLSDQMLVIPERYSSSSQHQLTQQFRQNANVTHSHASESSWLHQTNFDSLELDSYGEVHLLLQSTLEEIAQLEESVGDITLLAGQSSQTLETQHRMLNHLRDDLMWARMLPLSEILNRFPRTLRDLSATHHKPVELKLTGTGVLVDKVVVEKLYDPLLHLLRNAFDHGIEQPDIRRQQGKREQGQIEIRAYHQGSQTVIEVKDDGQGINLERVRKQAISSGLLSVNQASVASSIQLLELIFEPGFSTATQVSELSGRGVGLDVVRSQLQAIKGTVTVTSEVGQGTTFTLRIPLTLTIAKLLVCSVGATSLAFPSDGLEEIVIPKAEQTKQSGGRLFLHWRDRLVPVYQLSALLDYACPLPFATPSEALMAVATPKDWASPLLLLRQGSYIMALEVDRLITEQELVIKPFGGAVTPPDYIYGCTILGDGGLVPVIDSAVLMSQIGSYHNPSKIGVPSKTTLDQPILSNYAQSSAGSPFTVLLVDDSVGLRQTLALTLQKAGYQVLQARDGREAIEQLEKNQTIQLVVCDIEMPNMNGFEFLNHRRKVSALSKIPVVMLTYRSSDKHRRLAMHLGASAYVTKPYLEQEFLDILSRTLNSEQAVHPPMVTH